MAGRSLRILYISPEFAPRADSDAFCSAKMALALREQGLEVVTIHDPPRFSGHKTAFDTSSMWDVVRQFSVAVGAPEEKDVAGEAYCTVRYGAFRMHPRWVASVVERAAELHREKPFDMVYSWSQPLRAHVAGYWSARRLGVPWFAHINDVDDDRPSPGTTPSLMARLGNKVSKHWLRKTLRSADGISVPCPRMGALVERLAGVRSRAIVLPHVGRAADSPGPAERFHLVHACRIGRNVQASRQSSIFLLIGLAEFLEDHPDAKSVTKLKLVGPRDLELERFASDLGLGDSVEIAWGLSYENGLKAIASSAACIVVEGEAKEGVALPPDLADYVAAGKPVLAMSPAVGTMADLSGQRGILRVGPEDAEAVAGALSKLYADFRAGRLAERSPSSELVGSVAAESVAKTFLAEAERRVFGTRPATEPEPEPFIDLAPAAGAPAAPQAEGTAGHPLISFVILTRNRRDMVVKAIAGATAQNYPAKEIIVVDNGSTDGTAELLREHHPEVRVVASRENMALTIARNYGIRAARGEFIILMDDDCVLSGEDCARTVASNFLADETCGAVAFRIADPITGDEWPYSLYDGDRPPMAYECGVFRTGGVALRRKALEEAGLFWEPLFIVHEDTELAFRIITAGWRIVARSDIIVWHPAAEKRGKRNPKREVYYKVRNTTWLALKTLPFETLPGLLFLTYARSLSMALRTGNIRLFIWGLVDSGRGATASLRERRPLTTDWIRRSRWLRLKLWM